MKKHLLIALLTLPALINAQTTSTFEEVTLAPNNYWNGSTAPMGTSFTSGNAMYENFYDTSWGGYWASGWAYSNIIDTTNLDYSNLYGARTGIGYGGSSQYAVGQQNTMIKLSGNALGKVVNGFYVTNGSYAYGSIKDGDGFARKFGDTTGTGSGLPQGSQPDWFKLTVRSYYNGVMTNDSVGFYLADYTFANNSQDYIVKTWEWVDLTSLGNVDSLTLTLRSTDNGSFGMNTPAFFMIDNFITADSPVSVNEINSTLEISVYPNPADDVLNIVFKENITSAKANVYDLSGRIILSLLLSQKNNIDIGSLTTGMYILDIDGTKYQIIKK
jgi:hypothetical protein